MGYEFEVPELKKVKSVRSREERGGAKEEVKAIDEGKEDETLEAFIGEAEKAPKKSKKKAKVAVAA